MSNSASHLAFYSSPRFFKQLSCFKRIQIYDLDWSKILLVDAYRCFANPNWVEYQSGHPKHWAAQFGMIRFFLRQLLWRRESFRTEVTANNAIDFLFFKSLQRPDYDRLFQSAMQSVPNGKRVLSIDILSPQADFNWRAMFQFAMHIRQLLRLVVDLGAFEGFYFYCNSIRYSTLIASLRKFKPQMAVVFADMQPIDNAIAQSFKQRGIKTATLQHGLYVDYGNAETINRANYENVVCDYFLAWGERTAELILQHHPTTVTVNCGHPALEATRHEPGQGGNFFVFLDQKIFAKENQRLLDIAAAFAEATGWVGHVGVHPRDSLSQYRIASDLLNNASHPWKSCSFAIGHSSSIVYQALRAGLVVFQMNSDVPRHHLPKEWTFDNGQDLLKKWKTDANAEALGKLFISEVGEKAASNYRHFFATL